MKEVGLTVGGFYKHFDSRDDFVVEALRAASWQRLGQPDAGEPSVNLAGFIDEYLSERHRDRPGSGCLIGALAGDVARSNKRIRALATEKVRSALELIAGLLPDKQDDAGSPINGRQELARKKAALVFSSLVGAIALSRAVSDPSLSDEILKSVRELLKSQSSS
jgi:TetR/AcrR family transcriptional repressor of nem operon